MGMANEESSLLAPPAPVADPNEIDLEAGPGEQFQCRICLETDGRAILLTLYLPYLLLFLATNKDCFFDVASSNFVEIFGVFMSKRLVS